MAILQGATSGNKAEVDANGNLLVNMPQNPQNAGYGRMLSSSGDPIDVTENSYLKTSLATMSFYDQVDGNAVNSNLWNQFVSGMTIVQANGFIGLNAGQAITANAYAILSTIKTFPVYGTLPIVVSIVAKVLNVPESNATVELGILAAATNGAPSDGAFFRWNAAGQFVCVINNAGAESATASLTGTFTDPDTLQTVVLPPTPNLTHLYEITVVEDSVIFSIDDVNIATVNTPSGQAYPFNAGRQNIGMRVYNGGSTPSLAPQLYLGNIVVAQDDLNQNRPWQEALAILGRGAYQSPITPFAQSANKVNSTAPTSATLSNTAAGYATFGGEFAFAAPAGAVTDYALFAFQVPTGYQLFLNSIAISIINTGAIGGLTGSVLRWALGLNSSAVSLATTDSTGSGVWAPRRIPIGIQSLPISAAIGFMPTDISRRFDAPLIVDSQRYLHLILTIPVGLATVSQVIQGTWLASGVFE